MNNELFGASLAFGTALCWCISALAFEEASRRAGSLSVNLLRLIVAFALLTGASLLSRRVPLPTDATSFQWTWLLLSGVIGFFVGDAPLFRAFVLLGARITTLIACTAPIFALLAEQFILPHTRVGGLHVLAVLITIGGVAWVVIERGANALPPTHKVAGIVFAITGAAGQGVGAVLTAKAFQFGTYDAFAANQIRMLAAIGVFAFMVIASGRVRDTLAVLKNAPTMGLLSLGAFAGPFLGVSMFIHSLNFIPPSVTQTITSLMPVLIIPLAMFIRNERVNRRAIFGACVSVVGVWLLIYASKQ